MSEYKDSDRERSQKTLTLVEQSIKQNDERYDRVGAILEKYEDKFDQHDKRINLNKAKIAKVMTIGTIVLTPVTIAVATLVKKFIG